MDKEQIVESNDEVAIVVYAMIVAVIFCGCNPQLQNESAETHNGNYVTKVNTKTILGEYVTKVIDSCEYIEYDHGSFDQRVYSLIHKGNCKFCAERSKK